MNQWLGQAALLRNIVLRQNTELLPLSTVCRVILILILISLHADWAFGIRVPADIKAEHRVPLNS
jgi:hypothetical protein